MNKFIRNKNPIKMFFHYQSMFSYVSSRISLGMIRAKNHNISRLIVKFSSIPIITIFSLIVTIVKKRNTYFFSNLGRHNLSFLTYGITLKTTIFRSFYPIRFNFIFFFTYQTFCYNHFSLHLKRLFSVCLVETVKFLHLLRAKVLAIKNPFPLSNISIAYL